MSGPELVADMPDALHAPRGPLLELLAKLENLVLALALAGIVFFPVSDVVLRRFSTGISGSTTLAQHLTLLAGMLGGAIAAREGRMLALSTADTFLKGRWRSAMHVFSHGVASAIALCLAEAGRQWVLTEIPQHEVLAWGIPRWMVQAILPLGFALVALRFLLHERGSWKERTACAAITVAILIAALHPPCDPQQLITPALVVLGLATLVGAPIFVTLGGAALILFWGNGETIASIPVDHYKLVTNPTLPSIPLFTLAGYFFAEGGASKRLISVFQSLFGSIRGGPAIMTALVCAFFTSFTGASGVTILALGGLLMPILLSARYSERAALGLITGAGSLGLLLPPCLPLILCGIIAHVPINNMFLGGILPGTLMIALTISWGIRCGPRLVAGRPPFDARAAWSAIWAAKWELALPAVALCALFSTWATPVEASAITALYAFVVEAFVYRDLKLGRGTLKVLVECGLVIGGVLIILGVAQGFTGYLNFAEIPSQALDWVRESVRSPYLFLLLLNVFLLIVGSLMDIFSAIIVVVPLIMPMGEAYGIHPVHLGIVFLANLELGYMMPPVGMNLLLASYRLRKPVPEVYRAALPMIGVLLVGVLLITYVPWMTTWLPGMFGTR
jgi:tripartite ATP-independent transporter DctM subunit